jgi:hypothetical protein
MASSPIAGSPFLSGSAPAGFMAAAVRRDSKDYHRHEVSFLLSHDNPF